MRSNAAATAAAELQSANAALHAEAMAEEQRLEAARRHGDELRAARRLLNAAAAAVESVRIEMSRSSEEQMAASEQMHTRTLAAIKAEAAAEVDAQARAVRPFSTKITRGGSSLRGCRSRGGAGPTAS